MVRTQVYSRDTHEGKPERGFRIKCDISAKLGPGFFPASSGLTDLMAGQGKAGKITTELPCSLYQDMSPAGEMAP